jgi:hypothetical protein
MNLVFPAFVRSTLFDVSVVRKTVLCGRVQAAYDYYFVPAVSVGVFAGYRLMKTTIPGDVLSSLIVYEESVGPSGGTIERLTEITLPDLSVDGSGPFAGLRIGFRI